MAIDLMTVCLKGLSHKARLQYQACIQCGPVLKGIKVSNIVVMKRDSWQPIAEALKGSAVSCIPFYIGERTEVLMLYRLARMNELLQDPAAADCLRAYGHKNLDFPSVVFQFRRNYLDYDQRKRPFPHELGILLGYPVEDVKDFIVHQGRDYLLAGHWKVYHDPVRAQETFALYDQARKTAVRQILSGQTLKEVAAASL